MNPLEILTHCDHTLLRPDCTAAEVRALCDEAIRYGCAAVCIPPAHVAGAKKYVGSRMRICTVIGFPNGYATAAVKAFEAKDAVRHGADELDMVANLSMVKDACWGDVLEDIQTVRRATEGKILKVIIETCLLTEAEKLQLCTLVSLSGADYIKTSTGFSTGGATTADVALLRAHCDPRVKVKAAGGISTLADAEALLQCGADRLGSSRLVRLAAEAEAAQHALPSSAADKDEPADEPGEAGAGDGE
ncbi:MAG: deoxyribose-phosphate aldolase [Oscillospiraceae bacterium]|nr:deoxyribose-phosphate aldolase [Oscillospiraceae bacterium]